MFNIKLFTEKVRHKRFIELRKNMRDCAKSIGISLATLSRVENENTPDIVTFIKICVWLDVSMDEFKIIPMSNDKTLLEGINWDILWSKLPDKELDCKDYVKRVLMFDPINVPNVYKFNPYNRHHGISVLDLFPVNGKLCGCGCGQEIKKPRRRWATNECESFAVNVRFIVAGVSDTISKFLRRYYGWNCSMCGCGDKGHDMGANGSVSWIKVDHIIPVKLGGGACWLSNYQLLCHDCHVAKTNKDFNWKQPEQTNQLPLFNYPMSNKLLHTTNDETILSGIHLDEEFKEARERKKPPIKPYPKHLKEALEKSIVTVVNRNDGSMECGVNTPLDGLADQISNIS